MAPVTATLNRTAYNDWMDPRLIALASRDHGLIALDEVDAVGVSRDSVWRALRGGHLERVHPKVFRVAGSPPSRTERVRALTRWAGPGAAESHLSAAARLGLLDGAPGVEITSPRRLRNLPPGVTVHLAALPPEDITLIDAIPVTTMPRTIVDAAARCSLGELETMLVRAGRSGMPLQRLERRAGALMSPRAPGVGRLRTLLNGESESMLAARIARILERGGLPRPQREHRVTVDGRVVARLDLAYPEERIGIEADGWRAHRELDDFQRDRSRQNELVLLDWLLLRYTWADAEHRPRQIQETARRAWLQRRGRETAGSAVS